MTKNYVLRGRWYYYQRRVPKRLAKYDRRQHVRIALKTREEKEARRIAAIYDDFMEKYWRSLVEAGQPDEDGALFREARLVAQAHGFAYKNVAEVAASPLHERLARIELVASDPATKRDGLLGLAQVPAIKLSECTTRFWPLCTDRLTGKSEHQIAKYKNPRNAAVANFIQVVGDLKVADIQRSHVLQFRNWFLDRIGKKEISGDTANKQMRHIKDILHTVALDSEISKDFNHLFAETRVRRDTNSRPSFEVSYVQETLLNSGALSRLNDDAQALVHMMADTGARESEILGLEPCDFFMEDEVPYIWIRENEIRALKTKWSDRKIPLVGVSLKAARRIARTGITRYRMNPDTASASINKYLRENKLKPTPKHTLYSLRHTFKDRLRDARAPTEVIDELMGHKTPGPKYGRGHLLEEKHEWLKKIAFN